MAASEVLTAKKAAKYKNVLRRSITAGHKLRAVFLVLEVVAVVREFTGKKNE